MTRSIPDLFAVGRYVDVFNRALTFAPPPLRGLVNALDQGRGFSMRLVLTTHGVSSGPDFALRCRHGLFEVAPRESEHVGATVTISRPHLYEVISKPWMFYADPRRFELGVLLRERAERPTREAV